MSRDIVDTSAPSARLVVAAGVEGQPADQFAGLGIEDADASIGDEQLDRLALVGAPETGGGCGMLETQRFWCLDVECPTFDRQATTVAYDFPGRVVFYEDADGNKATTTYDLLGRPVTVADAKGTQAVRDDAVTGQAVGLSRCVKGGVSESRPGR